MSCDRLTMHRQVTIFCACSNHYTCRCLPHNNKSHLCAPWLLCSDFLSLQSSEKSELLWPARLSFHVGDAICAHTRLFTIKRYIQNIHSLAFGMEASKTLFLYFFNITLILSSTTILNLYGQIMLLPDLIFFALQLHFSFSFLSLSLFFLELYKENLTFLWLDSTGRPYKILAVSIGVSVKRFEVEAVLFMNFAAHKAKQNAAWFGCTWG